MLIIFTGINLSALFGDGLRMEWQGMAEKIIWRELKCGKSAELGVYNLFALKVKSFFKCLIYCPAIKVLTRDVC